VILFGAEDPLNADASITMRDAGKTAVSRNRHPQKAFLPILA
jgi:hypothetical protein